MNRLKIKAKQFVSISCKRYKPLNLCAHMHLQEVDWWNIYRSCYSNEVLIYFPEMKENPLLKKVSNGWKNLIEQSELAYKDLVKYVGNDYDLGKASSKYWFNSILISYFKGKFPSYRHSISFQLQNHWLSLLKKMPKTYFDGISVTENQFLVPNRKSKK